ncbi:MAG: hypothetical protein R3B47_07570 [Bacteroidia bacterium]
MGGFSSGGNVSLLLADYLQSSASAIQVKGLFVVDSPIDLMALYDNAQQTIERNVSQVAVQEANWIVGTFDADFGHGDTALAHYNARSPYHAKTRHTANLSHLQGISIRLYTEPDTAWMRVNRQARYENMNAYYLEKLAADLAAMYGESQVEYVTTETEATAPMERGIRIAGRLWIGRLVEWMGRE